MPRSEHKGGERALLLRRSAALLSSARPEHVQIFRGGSPHRQPLLEWLIEYTAIGSSLGRSEVLHKYPTALHSVLPIVLIRARNGPLPRSQRIPIRWAVYGFPGIHLLRLSEKGLEWHLKPLFW
jgi:hypothetical protein